MSKWVVAGEEGMKQGFQSRYFGFLDVYSAFKAIFRHRMCLQPNKHLHEQLLN